MAHKLSLSFLFSFLLVFVSCNSQEATKEHSETPREEPEPLAEKKKEPHQYGGWYCPDNFGFVPVDVQKLDAVPAIADRLPTEQELRDNKSLIAVDTAQYPDARALEMELPRVARIHSTHKGMDELIIVIQAIVVMEDTVMEDTVVGYRFANGGNGSAWLSEVTFLSADEVAGMGSQPFYYSTSVLNASKEDIWRAITKTDYAKGLGEKFNQREFFAAEWTPESHARLDFSSFREKASGYVATVFGNVYLHIDYDREGFHYSEKLLMIENQENHTTELFFASGPYPDDFEWKV